MTPSWTHLDEQERANFRSVVVFLDTRLADSATIQWALRLTPTQRVERLAVEELLNGPSGTALEEPWTTTWRLIEESWSTSTIEEGPSTVVYGIRDRLLSGDYSGATISRIVDLVNPRLEVKPINPMQRQFRKKSRRPKTFDDLISATLTSGDLVDLSVLGLSNVTNVPFLNGLGSALDAAVDHGVEIARRLGWNEQRRWWLLGELARVPYVSDTPRKREEEDPDAFHRGIAPSVKLLYAVVARISELDPHAALPFVRRWQVTSSPIHVRLWAAAARNSALVEPEEIGAFLASLDNRHFWDLHEFPEIFELRAVRFGDLDSQSQKVVARRIRRGPPRSHWPREMEAARFRSVQLYWSVRELKRIEVAGAPLPPRDRAWMDAKIRDFDDLLAMGIDEGFQEAVKVYAVPPNPDEKYDTLTGAARLRALETALSATRSSWSDNPFRRANDWLQQPGKILLVLEDLESKSINKDNFPHVWARFGWMHSPDRQKDRTKSVRNHRSEAHRVLTLLNQLSDNTLSSTVDGVSAWLDSWKKEVNSSSLGFLIWHRVWPVAVEVTNSRSDGADDADLSVVARPTNDDDEPMDLDTLNTPAGRLVGVFLAACPSLSEVPSPFNIGSNAYQLREAVISATGRSGLIARHRLIEALPYFLRADRAWTEQHLIAPLLHDDAASLALWRAIARRTHFRNVLEVIGDAMAQKATDFRLGRETRGRLVFSLIVETLHAFREHRAPAVPNPRITQMLRTLDDEVRASAAQVVQQFVEEISSNKRHTRKSPSPADVFRHAASPFLKQVWPQEHSLSTPGVSRAFADLPATSGEAFSEAVSAIERFLVPFECWSLLDYGLRGREGEEKKLVIINNEAKAKALLRLFERTIGGFEAAVVPYDLTEALDQIRSVAPDLAKDPVYRRLSTAARR